MISTLILSVMAAGTPVDNGWLAWQGCWHVDQSSTELLCIVPADDAVRLITVAEGQVQSETRLAADGVARPFEKEGCRGTEQAQWSRDGQRVFLTTDMTCGDTRRTVTGVMAMRSRADWVNVQAVTVADRTVTRVIQYTAANLRNVPDEIAEPLRATTLARETARHAASAYIDLEDVKEAVTRVADEAVTTWLTALNQPFDLNGRRLVALADAGVPSTVIDMLVAVSHPEHFAVQPIERPRLTDRDDDDDALRGYGYDSRSCYGDVWQRSPLLYSGYGYNNCYRGGSYSLFGYDPYWAYNRTPVIIVRGPVQTQNPNARVTREGYTSGSTPQPARTSGGSSDNSGKASSDSGSSASSTGRTAKPRDNNN